MKVAEARTLIAAAPIGRGAPQQWLDLGSGAGTFTLALAELLPAGSHILAVDVDAGALRTIPAMHAGVVIETHIGDAQSPPRQSADGVLLANLLHFVEDQPTMLERLATVAPLVLLVEYDSERPKPPWVPYPVSRTRAINLFRSAGYSQSVDLGSRTSRYGPERMYAMAFQQQPPSA